jgi:ribosomal protein L35
MGKLKTIKAVSKRVRVTKTKKIIKKTAGQDHFNSRESGKVTREKRSNRSFISSDARNIKRFLPYS